MVDRGGSAHDRAKARTQNKGMAASGTKFSQDSAKSIQPSELIPWYEGTLLWGAIGLFGAIVLVVVAAVLRDLRWLLILAWPFGCLAAWAGFKQIRRTDLRWSLGIASYVVIAVGLFSLNTWLGHSKIPDMANKEIKPIEPMITWTTPAPISYGTQLSTDQLNARAFVDEKEIQGFFAYSPGIGTIVPTGSQMLIAMFTPSDGKRYMSVTKTAQLLVNPSPVKPAPKTSLPIAEAQVKELQAVGEFIARKDEMALRETFDLPNILAYNIKMVRRGIVPSQVSPSESQQIDDYFKGGQARLDARFMNVQTINHRIDAHFIPGKIGIINTSSKYIQSRAQLAQYCASPLLPSPVIQALNEFDETIERDMVLMIESLNDSLSSDPRNIIENDQVGSNWLLSAWGLYWTHFHNLRPKSEKVSSEIRAALGVR